MHGQISCLNYTKNMSYMINEHDIENFMKELQDSEHSMLTIKKYHRDILHFYYWLPPDKSVDKKSIILYKEYLSKKYAISSTNSMLTALNRFLRFMGYSEFTVKTFKAQRKVFCLQERELSREDYIRLLHAAKRQKKWRIYLIMQTLCSTGIRISELPFITIEALKKGRADVRGKGKTRTILIPEQLCNELLHSTRRTAIKKGPVFVTRTGRPVDRSNIWSDMKGVCQEANVIMTKVFPHNLRHLFARTFYQREKDIVSLADVLGHSSVDTTRIYVISTGAEHLKKIEALNLMSPFLKRQKEKPHNMDYVVHTR